MSTENGRAGTTTRNLTVDVTERGLLERDLAAGDIAHLVTALLTSIERGEITASPREVEFLSSIGELLDSGAA